MAVDLAAELIGRDHPAAVLRAQIGRAAESHGGLVLVTGEAGIGKTTLVTAAAEDARRLGALVLGGACWDSDSAPGYWPWVQVVRGLRRGATAEEWTAAEAAAGGTLPVLLGEPGNREAGNREAGNREAADGFPLYDAVTTALVAVSQRRPVVVILDDLHWADTASLRLLEFAARHTWFERLLLVGTYRDAEVEAAGHPVRPLMMPLVAKATTVTLTGLDRDEVGALIARTSGGEPAAELVDEVHRRTGGNPFFVEQTARLWHSGGSLSTVPPGVREAIRQRLSVLPRPVVRLLTTAAVLGRKFHRQLLAAAAAAPVAEVDRMLDQAVTARLVTVLGDGRFAFAHDLVRETLYDSLPEDEARRQHAAVVRAVDRAPAAPFAGRILPPELAGHAYLAGGELEPARAVHHLLAAARDAGSRLAWEEAIGHRRRALERVRPADPRRRVLIALELGRDMEHVGESDLAGQAFEEAVAVARELADAELLTRVALTVRRIDGRDDLLAEAYGKLIGGPAPSSVDETAHELTTRVAALARDGDDDETLAFSLWARHDAIWGLGTAPERGSLTEELMAVARRIADPGMEYFAASFRWVALLELGEPGYLDQYRAFVGMARREGRPRADFASAIDTTIISTLTGRFGEAEAMLDRATSSFGGWHVHFKRMALHMRWALLLMQGRFDELDEVHLALRESGHVAAGLLEGVTAVHCGDVDTALRLLEDTQVDRAFAPLGLRFRAQTAAASRDPRLIAEARDALSPYAGQWVVSMWGCDVSGPFDLWLGLLDAAQERWDGAAARLTAAYQSADRLQARPWSVEARSHLARVLLVSGAAREGSALLAEVQREAAELAMRHLAGGAHGGGDEFRRDGPVWVLSFAGRSVHVPDAKGLHDLHHLLSQPGTDVPAVHLLDPQGGAVVVAARRMGGDPVLDEEAKAQYKRRLAQLDEEIDRAAELGDDRRAATADAERQALLDELRRAAGLAGRDRRLGDEAERARKTVTARIRDTLRKLDRSHPSLAAHLRDTVSTGVTCRYQPTQPTAWRL
jgi:AAA ATPase domain